MFRYSDALHRCWPIFVDAARARRTVSYSELAGRAGRPLHHRQIHRQVLKTLSQRCEAAGLPNLSALVVRAGSGLPGGGWFDPAHPEPGLAVWAEEVLRCYQHAWPKEPYATLFDAELSGIE